MLHHMRAMATSTFPAHNIHLSLSSSSFYPNAPSLLLRSSFCTPFSSMQASLLSSSSFFSWLLRRIPLPLPLHGLPRITSPAVSFFKFGSSSPQLPDIVEAGDPVLHEIAAPVPIQEITSARVQKVIADMVAVMRAAPGVGLSAPQIGVPWQIIVLEDTKEYISYAPKEETDAQQRHPFDLLVICNPTLRKKGDSTASFFEGCLSVQGFRGLVERYLEVEVTGYGQDGLPISVDAYGWQARILQHECDHLKGFLYVDMLIPRTFRTVSNLRLPLPTGCPKPGVCLKHGGSINLEVD